MRTSPIRTVALVAFALLAGCATTTVEFSGSTPTTPLCQGPARPGNTVVLWVSQWRPDQKDVPLREAAAEQGLKEYFAESTCFLNTTILGAAAGTPPNAEQAKQLALAADPRAERVIIIVVRELGPVVKLISSAALVEGGTEVVLDVSSFSAADSVAATEFTVHWKNGGPGVVKGVSTLPQDMRSALAAAFEQGTAPR